MNDFDRWVQEGMRRAKQRESMQKMHDDLNRNAYHQMKNHLYARGVKCIFCGCDMSQTHKPNCDTLNHDGKLLTN